MVMTTASLTATIHPTDLLNVTFQRGRDISTISMSGLSAMGDVMKRLRNEAQGIAGVVRVIVRNRTQGWAQQHTLAFRNSPCRIGMDGRTRCDMPTLF